LWQTILNQINGYVAEGSLIVVVFVSKLHIIISYTSVNRVLPRLILVYYKLLFLAYIDINVRIIYRNGILIFPDYSFLFIYRIYHNIIMNTELRSII